MARAICGVFQRGEGIAECGADVVEPMLAALPGRGGAKRTDRDAVSFGCRELWDGAAGPEQGHCSARGLTVAADARLDNRAELADALGLAGPERVGIGDTELILRAYERWGADCPPRLYGDYAFAVWDSRKRLLFCARDAVGVRPFFYSSGTDGRFVFASDAVAVLAAPGVTDELDEAHVTAYLMGGLPEVGGTFFRAVRSLPPGHSIASDAGGKRIRRWWRPEDAPLVSHGSDADYQQEFLDRYRRAVRERLWDAHPLGVHLSGGLDSSSVAVLAARELRAASRRPHVFCWHPPPGGDLAEEEAAEYRLIESVCAQEGLSPRYHRVSAGHALAMLSRDGVRFSNRDGTLIHESLVQRSAAELDVRVILSGWGGDEFASNAGTGYYAELLVGGRLGRLLREARGASDRPWRFLVMRAVLPLLHYRAPGAVSALLRGELPRRRKKSFVHPSLSRKRGRRSKFFRPTGIRWNQFNTLTTGHLAQRMEDWTASGARAGVEYRYPLLDRGLIEFVMGLPSEQFRYGSHSRWFFRQSMRSVLPPLVLEHSAKTDPARIRPFQKALHETLLEVFRLLTAHPEPPVRARYLDMAMLRAYLETEVAGRPQKRSGKIYRALTFLDWQ